MEDDDRAEVMKLMEDTLGIQGDPKIGIFWYDPHEDELFGVSKIIAPSAEHTGRTTINILHKDYWQKEYFKAKSKGKKTRFVGDYTQVPRGRVFKNNSVFEIYTGRWIDDYPSVKELVLDEFDLKSSQVVWIQEEHWDIGHGWDGD